MNLFNVVPKNYFSIFQGKNKEIYIESLELLYSLFQNDETLIKKNDFLSALKNKEAELKSFDLFEELSDEEKENVTPNTSSKASFILRRLEECGWVDVVMDIDSYEEVIVLPAYTISLIKTFSEIVSEEEAPYSSLVHSTYSELRLEDEDLDELLYPTLLRSYENTKKLKIELITLTHSIKIFQNKLSNLFDTNEVLHSYFDVYKKRISDRYYHPLKTFDSVAKYKRPIIRILNHWLTDKEIRDKLIHQASLTSKNNKKEDIENDVITKINYICDTYETLNRLISNIDKENNEYTKSSTQKILYLNNSDRSVKGHLENIFKYYASNVNSNKNLSKILSMMQDSLYFYESGYIDSSSVSLPLLKKFKVNGEPLKILSFDEANDFVMDAFLEETKNIYTDERVFSFMKEVLKSKDSIEAKDIPLNNFDALVCLILATIKKDDNDSFYDVEEIDNSEVKVKNYIIPNFRYKRKVEETK